MQDLGSREGIAKAKFEITTGLKTNGIFIYDGDEPLLKPHVNQVKNAKLISIGLNSDSTYTCHMNDVKTKVFILLSIKKNIIIYQFWARII